MNKILLWVAFAIVVAAAIAAYISHTSRNRLDIAPDAQREIDKAKRK